MSLLGVVVVDETDATASYAGVLHDNALHNSLHLIGLGEVVLNVWNVVLDGHSDIRHDIGNPTV